MKNPLIQKLECFAPLSDEEKRLLADASRDIRSFDRKQDIIREGDDPGEVHLLLEGWAGRYKILPNGDRPIMAFLIPGDLCDVQVTLLTEMDHSITALSPCKVAFIPREAISKMLDESLNLSRALWWSTLVDEAILREWLVTTNHRAGDKRLGHLICEMLLRSKAVGLADDNSFDLPLTQEELGDAMGLTPVHLNRMMQQLRGESLITTKGKHVTVNDLDRLMAFSDFNRNYLHQEGGRS